MGNKPSTTPSRTILERIEETEEIFEKETEMATSEEAKHTKIEPLLSAPTEEHLPPISRKRKASTSPSNSTAVDMLESTLPTRQITPEASNAESDALHLPGQLLMDSGVGKSTPSYPDRQLSLKSFSADPSAEGHTMEHDDGERRQRSRRRHRRDHKDNDPNKPKKKKRRIRKADASFQVELGMEGSTAKIEVQHIFCQTDIQVVAPTIVAREIATDHALQESYDKLLQTSNEQKASYEALKMQNEKLSEQLTSETALVNKHQTELQHANEQLRASTLECDSIRRHLEQLRSTIPSPSEKQTSETQTTVISAAEASCQTTDSMDSHFRSLVAQLHSIRTDHTSMKAFIERHTESLREDQASASGAIASLKKVSSLKETLYKEALRQADSHQRLCKQHEQHIDDLKSKLENANKIINSQLSDVHLQSQITAQLEAKDEAIVRLQTELADLRTTHAKVQEEHQKKVSQLESTCERMSFEMEKWKLQCNEMQNQKSSNADAFETQISALQAKFDESLSKLQNVSQELQISENRHAKSITAHSDAEKEWKIKEGELQRQLADMSASLFTTKGQLQHATSECDDIRRQSKSHYEYVLRLQKQLDRSERALQRAQKEIERLKAESVETASIAADDSIEPADPRNVVENSAQTMSHNVEDFCCQFDAVKMEGLSNAIISAQPTHVDAETLVEEERQRLLEKIQTLERQIDAQRMEYLKLEYIKLQQEKVTTSEISVLKKQLEDLRLLKEQLMHKFRVEIRNKEDWYIQEVQSLTQRAQSLQARVVEQNDAARSEWTERDAQTDFVDSVTDSDTAKDALKSATEQIQNLQQINSDLLSQVSALKGENIALQDQLSGARRLHEEQKDSHSNLKKALDQAVYEQFQAQKVVEELTASIETLKEENTKITENLHQKDAVLTRHTEQMQTMEFQFQNRVSDLEAQLTHTRDSSNHATDDFLAQLQKAKDDICAHESHAAALHDQLSRSSEEATRLHSQIDVLTEELKNITTEKTSLLKVQHILEGEITHLQTLLDDKEARKKSRPILFDKGVQCESTKVEDVSSALTSNGTDISVQTDSQCDHPTESALPVCADAHTQWSACCDDSANLKSTLFEVTKKLKSTREEISTLKRSNEHLQLEFKRMESDLRAQQDEHHDLVQERDLLQKKLEAHMTLEAEYVEQIEAHHNALQFQQEIAAQLKERNASLMQELIEARQAAHSADAHTSHAAPSTVDSFRDHSPQASKEEPTTTIAPQAAAIMIQCFWRCVLAKRVLKHLRALSREFKELADLMRTEFNEQEETRSRAVVAVQCVVRMMLARQRCLRYFRTQQMFGDATQRSPIRSRWLKQESGNALMVTIPQPRAVSISPQSHVRSEPSSVNTPTVRHPIMGTWHDAITPPPTRTMRPKSASAVTRKSPHSQQPSSPIVIRSARHEGESPHYRSRSSFRLGRSGSSSAKWQSFFG